MLPVSVVRLDPDLPLPTYAHPGDAGLDLHARDGAVVKAGGGRAIVPTGIAVAIPPGFAGFVVPRSGLALRHGISLVNTPGIIDAAYRGELKCVLLNTDPTAEFIPEITAREALQRDLKVMDSTALALCMDNHLNIHVFNMADDSNINRIISGDRVGTLVTT